MTSAARIPESADSKVRAAKASADERVRESSLLRRVLRRPELGAASGAVLVWIFFALTAGEAGFLSEKGAVGYLEIAAQLTIIAVPVAMLMIAGEFDLSVGSMIGAAGVLVALPLTKYGWPLWACILLAFSAAALIGVLNGLLVVRTGLPSFVVTLAGLFILRGVTLAVTRAQTDVTQVPLDGPQQTGLGGLFGGTLLGLPASVYWALAVAVAATWILLRTRFGNWVFGVGGDEATTRNVGVPVQRVKILLFIGTAMSAALLALIQVMDSGSADVLRGEQKELQAIAAAVIGGTLLTGGYGSAVGAMLGALIFGMVSQGIFFSNVDADWFLAFLGGALLVAVLFNRYVRRRAEEVR